MTKRFPRYPSRKISETFLDFADPVLETLPRDRPAEEAGRVPLQLARGIWNCVIFAGVLPNSKYLDGLRRAATETKGPVALINAMVSRKRELYGDDERLIGPWEVTWAKEGIRVTATSINPFALPRPPAAS